MEELIKYITKTNNSIQDEILCPKAFYFMVGNEWKCNVYDLNLNSPIKLEVANSKKYYLRLV